MEKDQTIGNKKLNILLAEDDLISQKLTVLLVQRKGWTIRAVASGKEVLQLMEQENFDLILMDVQMPVMDGLEATRIIRKREEKAGGHIPIIALTAHAMKGDRERCLEAGMDGYVSKPIQEEELYDTILQIWAKYSQPYDFVEKPPANLSRLIKILGGSSEELVGLIQEFLEYYPPQMQKMEEDIQGKNASDLEKSAHKFKGSLSNFDAKEACDLAQQIEKMAKNNDLEEAHSVFVRLSGEMEKIKVYLENFR